MELRTVDPRSLKFNPNNPRRTKASTEQDAQLTANIRVLGVIQPPLVRQAGKALEVIAGERRVRCAIAAGLAALHVLVSTEADGNNPLRSLAENTQRAQMNPVDQWREIEALCGGGWSEEAIATAFSMTVRTIRKLRLLAQIHPAMLDRMAHDLPREDELRKIAAAPLEEQESAWKRLKPKRGQEIPWYEIVRALHKDRIAATIARFDDETARQFGVRWEEDLFGPAGEDNRTTTDIDAFFAAQRHWMETNLPENGVILETESWGSPKLPARSELCYGQPRAGDNIGVMIDQRTGEIREIAFRSIIKDAKHEQDRHDSGEELPTSARPEITRKGFERIGDLRTDALHQGLREAAFDDATLLGLLVLAFAGKNVTVRSPSYGSHDRKRIAGTLIQGGKLTSDLPILRQAARDMLTGVLSCREGLSRSGVVARIAGDAIDADRYLASMTDEEFLKCLSKSGIERAATEAGVPILPKTGKEMRAALIHHTGNSRFILPQARFALTGTETAALDALADVIPDVDASGLDDWEDDWEQPDQEENLPDNAGAEAGISLRSVVA